MTTVTEQSKLSFVLSVPPSSNNAYVNRKTKRGATIRVLSSEGQSFKQVAGMAARYSASARGWEYQKGQRIEVYMCVHFPTPYAQKRRDIENCLKLANDAIAGALGYDDSVVDMIFIKRGTMDKENPRCEVVLVAKPAGVAV